MGSRLQLQTLLETIIGNENVYYNPPENLEMNYPAIRYEVYKVNIKHANDRPYNSTIGYKLTVIGKIPNDVIRDELLKLPMCSFDRGYTYNGLKHDVLILYY
jgi:hypothetical protein